MQYANVNYFIAGEIIIHLSGQSYPSFINENIFKPLGMSSSMYNLEAVFGTGRAAKAYVSFGKDLEKAAKLLKDGNWAKEVVGEMAEVDAYVKHGDGLAFAPAGSLYTTGNDMVKLTSYSS